MAPLSPKLPHAPSITGALSLPGPTCGVGWILATLPVDVGLVLAVRWSSPKRAHGAASAAGAVEGEGGGVERGREGGHSILFAFYCKVQKAALVGRGAGQDLLQFWSTSGHAFAGLPAAGWSSLAMSARPGRPLNFGWIVIELPCDLTIGLAPPASSTARQGRPLIVGSIGADASLDSGPRTDSHWHCMFGQIDLLLLFACG